MESTKLPRSSSNVPGMPVSPVVLLGTDKVINANEVSAHDLCINIASLVKTFKQQMVAIAERHNLTVIQLFALQAIDEHNLTMGQMAQALHCDASNVTGIVDRLTALSLIIRQDSLQDRRVKTIALTASGKKVLTALHRELPKRLGCENFSDSERATFRRLIEKVNTHNSSTAHYA